LPSKFPEIERRRAGLDTILPLWIVLDEYNQDVIGQSLYLEPEPPPGRFSKAFFLPLMREFIMRRARTRGSTVDVKRTDPSRDSNFHLQNTMEMSQQLFRSSRFAIMVYM